MARPITKPMPMLYRIGRCFKAKPRLVWHYPYQRAPGIIDVFADANWSGCKRTRKSTSGGAVMLGSQCFNTYSKTQRVEAGSSAESELYGIVRGTCEALRICTLLGDLGCKVKARIHTDSNAASGSSSRKTVALTRMAGLQCTQIMCFMSKNISHNVMMTHPARHSTQKGRRSAPGGTQGV